LSRLLRTTKTYPDQIKSPKSNKQTQQYNTIQFNPGNKHTMAPRQRSISTTPTESESSYDSSDSLLETERRNRQNQIDDKRQQQKVQLKKTSSSTSISSAAAQDAADIARDKHDYFNLIALVSRHNERKGKERISTNLVGLTGRNFIYFKNSMPTSHVVCF
jgi:hypothetical protein